MLIEFKVLWVEDDNKWFLIHEKFLTNFLNSLGFVLKVDRIPHPNETDLKTTITNTSNYDLMLIDWRFKTNGDIDTPLGGEIISSIRTKEAYTEVLFYSGDPKFSSELSERELQGVYLADRKHFRDEAKHLIEYLLRKALHPKIMRGIIVSELSHIDDFCYKIIEAKYNHPKCNQDKFANELKKSINDQANKQLKDKERATKKPHSEFIETLHSTLILDSYKRASKVAEYAKLEGVPKKMLAALEKLPETVQKRNWLAHWKRSEENDDHIILTCDGQKDYVFDHNEAINMRKNINNAAFALQDYLAAISN